MYRFLTILLVLNYPTIAQSPLSWWKKNNLRVIQVNLPAYEAASLDPDTLVQDLLTHHANTVIINAGGIMAFYPTRLQDHYVNPYMIPDQLERVINRCHQHQISVVVRFDFSRIDHSIYVRHPDWAYIDQTGKHIINTDKYVTCINAPYVQEVAFAIISEVIDRYAIDGIFLNMPGYQVNNAYEGAYHGIDQNEHDKKRFKEWSNGLNLPVKEDHRDPIFEKYLDFKEFTTVEWQKKLFNLVKLKNPNIAICTYAAEYVDIIRHESQTNSLPYFPYNASDNVNTIMSSYPDHLVSNASIQQISFRSRYNAIEPEETEIRLWENIANGSGLDISMMGDFRNYEDPRNFKTWEKIYAHHKKYESYYGRYQSTAKVALIAPGWWTRNQEFRGLFQMLKEEHIQFDVIEDSQLAQRLQALKKYALIIMPDVVHWEENNLQALDSLIKAGVHLIATNRTLDGQPHALHKIFGAKQIHSIDECDGHYLSITDHRLWPRLKGQSLIHLKFNLGQYDFKDVDQELLPILTPGRPGPPEMIGGHTPTGYAGLGVKYHGSQRSILVALNLGKHYFIHGYENHKWVLMDLINQIAPEVTRPIQTNAHPRVEVIVQDFMKNDSLTYSLPFQSQGKIIHCINLTGFNGNSYFAPSTQYNVQMTIPYEKKPKRVYLLGKLQKIKYLFQNKMLKLTIPELKEYGALIIE